MKIQRKETQALDLKIINLAERRKKIKKKKKNMKEVHLKKSPILNNKSQKRKKVHRTKNLKMSNPHLRKEVQKLTGCNKQKISLNLVQTYEK